MDKTLAARLARHPVIATLYGADLIDDFIGSAAEISIVANFELRRLQSVVQALIGAKKYPIVNIDSCDGLSQDKGGVDYLAEIGAKGLVSTRVATVQRAKRAGLVAVQKVFVTDRSTFPRSVAALEQSEPHLVQLMPAPMLPHIPPQSRKAMPPIIASGFVCDRAGVVAAVKAGAVAVSTSDKGLWKLSAQALRGG
ncbi:glycerol-3-phosphate responsive antiterminator [Bradyrhizobium sp. U87765 SZCCT0131]|uniref:glycerol-3-phosphate responsive antiterminator n=1 Tax=unclassified Bradyrhizobium TaxID=2631580 RepID=UPI001BAA04C8|nr:MULTISPECIES: glycerol-3-phosphate responsive antiterminator [unclassified Bradyrhizobium]MBR1218083.1 glycerol-3-phosphate responsive antiterminator [Bradyrhizobium sp. U87765 SZCCT0131]MBR1260971.1 glycerol-3-phosphate responsive antiterminator [Bradyrhizobium sp. U87765 SZCCT0134]MBR1303581.1 glycerol-3-phosphate responsive antiterminator [Bradyrhizobium sp. U87765 SZCCT0110]MBR1319187.1 glycerol-3-phosphate responsive antiterminator [Bradyrhizobium sp. U87765 SZCCT0109]MBR1347512.1 glyc